MYGEGEELILICRLILSSNFHLTVFFKKSFGFNNLIHMTSGDHHGKKKKTNLNDEKIKGVVINSNKSLIPNNHISFFSFFLFSFIILLLSFTVLSADYKAKKFIVFITFCWKLLIELIFFFLSFLRMLIVIVWSYICIIRWSSGLFYNSLFLFPVLVRDCS